MSVPVLLVLAVVAMVTLVAIAAVLAQLVARLRRVADDLREIERELMPRITELQRGTEVTGREMERLGRALEDR